MKRRYGVVRPVSGDHKRRGSKQPWFPVLPTWQWLVIIVVVIALIATRGNDSDPHQLLDDNPCGLQRTVCP